MSSNTRLLIREAQIHESGMHEGSGPSVQGCEKNLGNVGLRSGQPEGPLLSGASCGGKRGLLAVRRRYCCLYYLNTRGEC
jgi:hypothetical protein